MANEFADILKREAGPRRARTDMQAKVVARRPRVRVWDLNATREFEMRALKEYALLGEDRAPILRRMERERSLI